MTRRIPINLIGIVTLSGIFLLLLFAGHRYSSPSNLEYFKRDHFNPTRFSHNKYTSEQQMVTQNLSISIEDILSYQRQQIADEMSYYEYPNGKFGVDAAKLEDLTPETNGNPMRSIIITSWRMGSTFLGDILNALPGNYYHYEPLLTFEIMQIRGAPHAKQAVRSLKKLLKCNYTDSWEYLEFGQAHNYLFSHNIRLWNQCTLFPSFCYQPKFLQPFCKLFPLQSMKVVRLRMSIAANLLEDPT